MASSRSATVSSPKPVAAKTGALKAGTTKVSFKVQILKAILYKHFPSKEDLAAATMVRVAGSCPHGSGQLASRSQTVRSDQGGRRRVMQMQLPTIAVFYTLCARACDPVLCTCFEGLNRPLFNSSSGY
jgi:TetR/AcrR family transcriptional regulator of autoinduction and epiphytic fitness